MLRAVAAPDKSRRMINKFERRTLLRVRVGGNFRRVLNISNVSYVVFARTDITSLDVVNIKI